MMQSTLVLRARILCGFFIVIALLLALRLYFVQIIHGKAYTKSAMGQYIEPSPDSQDRGNIFFTTKSGQKISAAVMQSGWRIAIQPAMISNPGAVYNGLSALVRIDKQKFLDSASKKDDPYEEVALRVPDNAAAKIRAKQIPGVLLVQDQWRYYPAAALAAQTVGFVGYQGDTKVGVYGLERQYQDTLSEPTAGLYVNPFAEIFTNVQALVSQNPTSQHGSIVTSIEPTVEAQLEKTLDQVMAEYSPSVAGGIIMNPHTGEIYAIAARPAFDPNTYNAINDQSVFTNPLVEGRYELGSIMKPLTMAAGIDSGAITPATTYNDTGCITRSTYKICNFDLKARGTIAMQEILNQSLNVGASFVADTMGHPTLTRYMKAYGFGEKTKIDLPNEVTGDIRILGNGTGPDVNFDTAAFGQGIAVSPIEMIRALSALANDGKLPTPHIVTGVKYESGATRAVTVPEGPQVLKQQTAQTVTNMLTTVFDKSLLKGALKMDHYSFAAKTGTAQIPIPGGGGYYEGTYLHSFFGYFPAHDPKFIIFLFAKNPHGQEFASATLAHPFMDIAQFLINYYSIPPDR
jgi:cell division protein FtsI/penicillin-binding protein 2